MDLDIIQSTKEGEITQFLCDARDYFKASLATSEYENTSNMFYMNAAERTEELLCRCELLLKRLNTNQTFNCSTTTIENGTPPAVTNGLENHQWQQKKADIKSNDSIKHQTMRRDEHSVQQHEDVSYLDMSAAHSRRTDKKSPSLEFVDMNSSADSDKTFRCSTLIVKQNKSFLHRIHDTMTTTTDEEGEDEERNDSQDVNSEDFEDDPQIYDICQVTTQGSDGEEDDFGHEETRKAITPDSHFSIPNIDCPYMDLPAGHLSIQKSTKYGQLQRIEKRLFFDQSKKCYCGILNDWLLCYAEGPTSNKPTISLYLKMPSIDIEHFGEGKRRDVCFQITTCDPSKRFVFQAVNEIDAKEWIHAIETAIRSDISGTMRNSTTRKLPTPPVMKKITFMNSPLQMSSHRNQCQISTSSTSNDYIYEEPSPIYRVEEILKTNQESPPTLPHKQNSQLALAQKYEYDVPKCPPQPLKCASNDTNLINPYADGKESTECLNPNGCPETKQFNENSSTQRLNFKMEEKLDFQAKVKDVHSQLTSQLTSVSNVMKPLKKSISLSSQSDADSISINYTPPTTPSTAEMKKQRKSSAPQSSPQKSATEKTSSTKNWFLNRLNKSTSSTRSNTSSSPSSSPAKSKYSEKENLLNSSDNGDGYDNHDAHLISNNSASPILKSSSAASGKSKVNMIINQLEASGHLATMFSVDAVASFSALCDNDCNNYEPIMTVSTPSSSFMKKV